MVVGHIVVIGLVALFGRLGWWQIRSALDGSTISIGYAAQWPTFASFGVFLWVRFVREHVAAKAASKVEPDEAVHAVDPPPLVWTFGQDAGAPSRAAPSQTPSPPDDPVLAEYNRMLEWLNADPRRRLSDYRPS
ncbi:hypothetical protein [Spirilliplanes yamanashiensis]|uniref:hypothetical protein n=1 Tax=Spirilliplanes yamanashiensis TaxID=42233 RepID=UPI002781B14E|nr:hypothetical protein [Spirilliplanes yamanashiensis]MDP9818376.1 hypothetical protein [Spirilliplanes yamanashiensis]